MELMPISTSDMSVGQLANEYASSNVFNDYQEKLADNTLKRHKDDIALFSLFLKNISLIKENLLTDAGEWNDITFGLVEAFKRWQIEEGYSIASINAHVSTIKIYAKLAKKAGTLSHQECSLIRDIELYSHKDGRNVDQKRKDRDIKTRVGNKKAESVSINPEQAKALKNQPNTPQGKRDAFLMCILLDLGLRCGEVASLTPENINVSTGMLTFYRQKVDKVQTHKLERDVLLSAISYLEICKPVDRLFLGSQKGGKLQGIMGERSITDRVKVLGEAIGIKGLSAHDCRHYWATSAARNGTDIKSLQDAGGWSSPAMPLRYVESAKIANEGVKLG